ncbi:MAG: GNAT family N-acetyltransferase [Actinomycetota bacterium]|nr:GNAT family N-acetyltransferase [Actinomycetota bacterium]
MRVRVTRPAELGSAELDRWRCLHQGSDHLGSPFLAAEYVRAVGAVRASVRVAVVEDGGQIVGFFPYEQRGRLAKPLGGGLSDCTGLVHEAGYDGVSARLLRGCGLVGWDFGNLLDEQVPAAARYVVRDVSPVLDLSGGYEAYLEAKRASSKNLVQSTLRKQRKMQREIGELRFDFESRDPAVLGMLMGWKSGQYREMGEWDRFADPPIVRLVRDLLGTASTGCAGTLSVLYAGDRPVAAHFGIRSRSALSWWFPAYDPALARYSPGLQLLFAMAEGAAERGVGSINLGMGEHPYKDAAKTADLVLARGFLDDSSPAGLARRAKRAPRYHARTLLRKNPRLHQTAVRMITRLAPGVVR